MQVIPLDGRAHGRDRTALIHEAIEQLASLADVFDRRRSTLAAEAGITVEQWRVMEEIATRHFMPSMFAKNRDSSAAAVSRTLRQLLDAGLISVAVSRNDGRSREYQLTASGAKTFGRLRERRADAIRSVWMRLAPAELENFTEFARRLVSAIETYSAGVKKSNRQRKNSGAARK